MQCPARRLAAAAAVLAMIGVLTLLVFPQRAHAHAVLVETVPADGAVLQAAPREVMLRFSEPVAPVMLRVLDINARPIADGTRARVDNATIRIALPESLPNATYVVTYRVISIDSHPVSGTIVFSVGDTPPPARDERGAQDRAVVAAVAATRGLFLAALLLAAGGVLAVWRVAGLDSQVVRRMRLVLAGAGVAALALAPLSLGVTGCYLAGASLAGLADPANWRIALAAPLAQSLAVAATGLTLILVALPRLDLSANRVVAVSGSLIALASFAFTGHAATAPPQWLMRWSVPVHALCAAFWLGALPLLLWVLRATPETAHRLVMRFSRHAVAAVALILALGLAIAVVQLEHFAMLWQSTYGIVLAGKLAAVALLLAVAAHNKWYATPLLAGDVASAASALRQAIHAEYLLFAAILAFTATLGQLEPPRSAVVRDREALAGGKADFIARAAEAGHTIVLAVAPARAGHNALAVEVTDAAGRHVTPAEVVLELALPAAGIEPIRRKAAPEPSGRFVYHSNDLALSGRWRIEVHVLIDDFTKRIVTFDVPIR
jgi:copper transport protein